MFRMESALSTLHELISAVCTLVPAVVSTLLAYLAARYCWELIPEGGTQKKAILITGCDTGFGRALSLRCAKDGFTVYSGCLTDQGRESLSKEASGLTLHAIPLDITKDDSVAAARKAVEDNLGGKRLWAVVNNAGIFSCYGPAEWCSPDEYRLSFEVNLIGAVRVTNAFLDLLKRSRGRVISVSSVAGRISTVGAAPYSVAKYGVEAWMDAIRRELRQFGVTVHLLEPGVVKATALLDKKAHDDRVWSVWNKMPAQLREDYGEEYRQEVVDKWNASLHRMGSPTIDHVVDNYYHALTARYPRMRYQCGWDAIFFWAPASFMPTPIQDVLLRLLVRGERPVPAIMKRGGYMEKTTSE